VVTVTDSSCVRGLKVRSLWELQVRVLSVVVLEEDEGSRRKVRHRFGDPDRDAALRKLPKSEGQWGSGPSLAS